MTTKQIDYCIELARTLNFSRAAENSRESLAAFIKTLQKLYNDAVAFPL